MAARPMVLHASDDLVVRAFEPGDAGSLAAHADEPRVAENLRDGFPSPYRLEHAEAFIASAGKADPPTVFAMVVGGAVVGGIGFHPQQDIERVSAEVGYWVAVPFWGRGLATRSLEIVTAHVWEWHPELQRLFALPFADNAPSRRVLEKAGYTLDAVLRKSAIKDGRLRDQALYSCVRE